MSSLTLSNSTIRGTVGQRQISCAFRVTPSGLRLPPGQYALVRGPQSPIYGTVLVLAPADAVTESAMKRSTASLDKSSTKIAASGSYLKIDTAKAPRSYYDKVDTGRLPNSASSSYSKVDAASSSYSKVEAASYTYSKVDAAIRDPHKMDAALGGTGSPAGQTSRKAGAGGDQMTALAVSSKAISGSACLVVIQGFSDLVESVGDFAIGVVVG